jgi:hypothetical protein
VYGISRIPLGLFGVPALRTLSPLNFFKQSNNVR